MAKIENIHEWHKIGDKLCGYLMICSCQRKLKSIVGVLVRIWEKGHTSKDNGYTPLRDSQPETHGFTPEEFLMCAWLDRVGLITHGVNCEYPIIHNNEFWDWLLSIKDSPYLQDN